MLFCRQSPILPLSFWPDLHFLDSRFQSRLKKQKSKKPWHICQKRKTKKKENKKQVKEEEGAGTRRMRQIPKSTARK